MTQPLFQNHFCLASFCSQLTQYSFPELHKSSSFSYTQVELCLTVYHFIHYMCVHVHIIWFLVLDCVFANVYLYKWQLFSTLYQSIVSSFCYYSLSGIINSLVSVSSAFKGGESSKSQLQSSNQMANSQLHKKLAPRIVTGHPANKM